MDSIEMIKNVKSNIIEENRILLNIKRCLDAHSLYEWINLRIVVSIIDLMNKL